MWTVDSLTHFFNKSEISKNAFSFYSAKEDAFCILKEGEVWQVVYVERGVKKTLGFGLDEAQALDILKLYVLESERGFR